MATPNPVHAPPTNPRRSWSAVLGSPHQLGGAELQTAAAMISTVMRDADNAPVLLTLGNPAALVDALAGGLIRNMRLSTGLERTEDSDLMDPRLATWEYAIALGRVVERGKPAAARRLAERRDLRDAAARALIAAALDSAGPAAGDRVPGSAYGGSVGTLFSSEEEEEQACVAKPYRGAAECLAIAIGCSPEAGFVPLDQLEQGTVGDSDKAAFGGAVAALVSEHPRLVAAAVAVVAAHSGRPASELKACGDVLDEFWPLLRRLAVSSAAAADEILSLPALRRALLACLRTPSQGVCDLARDAAISLARMVHSYRHTSPGYGTPVPAVHAMRPGRSESCALLAAAAARCSAADVDAAGQGAVPLLVVLSQLLEAFTDAAEAAAQPEGAPSVGVAPADADATAVVVAAADAAASQQLLAALAKMLGTASGQGQPSGPARGAPPPGRSGLLPPAITWAAALRAICDAAAAGLPAETASAVLLRVARTQGLLRAVGAVLEPASYASGGDRAVITNGALSAVSAISCGGADCCSAVMERIPNWRQLLRAAARFQQAPGSDAAQGGSLAQSLRAIAADALELLDAAERGAACVHERRGPHAKAPTEASTSSGAGGAEGGAEQQKTATGGRAAAAAATAEVAAACQRAADELTGVKAAPSAGGAARAGGSRGSGAKPPTPVAAARSDAAAGPSGSVSGSASASASSALVCAACGASQGPEGQRPHLCAGCRTLRYCCKEW